MNPRFFRNGIVMLLLVVVALAVVLTVVNQTTPNSNVAYSKFLDNVQAGQVTSALQEGSTLTVTAKDNTKYNVVIPGLLANQVLDDMTQAAAGGKVARPTLEAKQPPDNGWISILITGLLPILIIGGFIFFMMRQAQGTNNQALSFGKSRARMFLGNKTVVTFADALAAVRRELWEQTLLGHGRKSGCLNPLPRQLRSTLLWHLSAAA